MKEVVIISGKGGTGKTSLTASFATLAENIILCDADVDAAELQLLMAPKVQQKTDFMGGSLASIRRDDCIECGTCLELCKFEAISEEYIIDPIACEGCGVCVDLCPEQAVDFSVQKCGEWFISTTRYGTMVHASLGIAEDNSGKLVSLVRQQARILAGQNNCSLLLTDGPPGIGCPVIAAIGGATLLVIVVEPTVSGLHDMSRVAELAKHFRVPGLVCVNKYDLNSEMAGQVEAAAEKMNLMIGGRIPFDPVFTRAMVVGKNILEYAPASATAESVRTLWHNIVTYSVMDGTGLKNFQEQ